ncbi:MAG: autotransporter-associated beta strand repeat-containing protein, partial [Verrucomicrobiota bacterium]
GASGVTSLTLNPGSAVTNSYSGVIANLGSGAMALNMTGAGKQILTGANTYTGATTVSTGTLLVSNASGSGLGASNVTVNGGTLGGSGSFTGTVTVNSGGTLSPGSSIESLGSGSITFTGGTFAFEINTSTTTADLLFASGANVALTITSGVPTLTITDLGSNAALADGTKFTLISYNAAGGWNNGIFSGYANNSEFTLGANKWKINYADLSAGSNFQSDAVLFGDRFVTITVVPEPSTWALLAFSLTTVMVLRRRRKS